MRKYFCDSCGDEVKRLNKVPIPCHLFSFKGKAGYVDQDMNSVSGRHDMIGLCNKCNNIGYYAMLEALKLPRDEHLYKNRKPTPLFGEDDGTEKSKK